LPSLPGIVKDGDETCRLVQGIINRFKLGVLWACRLFQVCRGDSEIRKRGAECVLLFPAQAQN